MKKWPLFLYIPLSVPQRRWYVESVYSDSSFSGEVSGKHDDVLSIRAGDKFSDSKEYVDKNNNVSNDNTKHVYLTFLEKMQWLIKNL